MNRPVATLNVLAALVLAIACDSSTEPPPDPSASGSTPTKVEPVAEAGKAPAPAPVPADAKAEPPKAPTSPLHVVAHREGTIRLMWLGATLAAVLDGEPLPIVDGVPSRGKSGSRGLPNLDGYDGLGSTLAIAGTPSGSTWVSTTRHTDRMGEWFWVHRGDQGRDWEPVAVRKGPLVAYHMAYAQRGGALLGLRTWAPVLSDAYYDDGGESERARREWAAVQRAQAKVRTGFVRLEGPELPIPEIPAGLVPQAAVAASDGTIYALAKDAEDDDVLLVWPTQATKAERVELPDYDGVYVTLAASGDFAMVMGTTRGSRYDESESYLAVGRGTQWERVPLGRPGVSPDAWHRVTSAARAPTGELWISTDGLWHQPVDGPWETVALPEIAGDLFGTEEGFVYDVGGVEPVSWIPVKRPPLPKDTPLVVELAWFDGALWAVVELGDAYDHEAGLQIRTPRHVLLSTRPSAAASVRLPTRGEVHVERQDVLQRSGKPGKGGCQRPFFVLGPASELEARSELADAARKAGEGDERGVSSIYVGRLDGAEVLVASTHVSSTEDVEALRGALAEATGRTPAVECRIPALVRMVRS